MRMLSFLYFSIYILVSCNSRQNKQIELPVAIADSASFPDPPVVSQTEMKDDSIFADGSIPTTWANAGITDVRGLKVFLKELQLWVMNNDKEKIATTISYPLKDIKNEQEFIAAFDKYFTKEVKLSFATLNFNQLFRNQHGVMTDGGKVWIQQFDSAFKIFAINP